MGKNSRWRWRDGRDLELQRWGVGPFIDGFVHRQTTDGMGKREFQDWDWKVEASGRLWRLVTHP